MYFWPVKVIENKVNLLKCSALHRNANVWVEMYFELLHVLSIEIGFEYYNSRNQYVRQACATY